MPVQVVWFKRDIRIKDHAALSAASRRNEQALFIYIFDDFLFNDTRYSARHFRFISECLIELKNELEAKGHRLFVFKGEAINIFRYLHDTYEISVVFSYAETGIISTWRRDIQLMEYFQDNKIAWKEFRSNGIIRKMQDTNGWHNKWNEFMRQDEAFIDWHDMQVFKGELNSLELINEKNTFFQSGGSSQGRALLNSFLKERHKNYFITISRPYESSIYCSRLSPYLAWGALSMRQVVCETLHTTQQSGGNIHLRQFMSRLMWQAHFIQKFERETRMEFENINPMFNGVRLEINESLLQAWKAGETGYPLVDASMRCLHATGWINFRMRAMLVSFLTHHLWQPWQEGASYLASLFLDFEPGIHYPQIQMQAGTTGMHILRIYDPVKQSLEKDSEALFIKKWCPELSEIPAPLVHTPWKLSAMEQVFYNFVPGHTYPNRIVNTSETGVRAQKNLWPIINSNASKDFVNMYFKRHVISPERRRKEYMNKMESSLRLYQTDSETKNK